MSAAGVPPLAGSDNGGVAEARGGYNRSVPGLVGALIAVLALIVGVWLLSKFQDRGTPDPAGTVDYTAELAEARRAAPFDVLAPSPVPVGWRATSAEWDGGERDASWHLGFLTSSEDYVGLEQGNASAPDFVTGHTPATEVAEPVEAGGETWQVLVAEDGSEHALLQVRNGVTTMVTGTAPLPELVAFAEALTAD